jgi:DMSO/TMAO reductase YedYZ molybdopterin-dependent catalytic subunit/cytochrome b561
MTPRATDWGLAVLVAALIATGALTLFAGGTSDSWVFVAHDAFGAAIALLLVVKLRRVWPRVREWSGRAVPGVAAAVLAAATLGSGWLWAAGVTPIIAGFSLLGWHDALGVVVATAVAAHMALRAKALRARDLAHRRQFLIAAGGTLGSLIAWRAQRPFEALLALKGARRRFTGSYEADSFAGNAFPTTSWVADKPLPIDVSAYRLRLHGLVVTELELTLRELPPTDEMVATLDCTGGFYSTQRWRGVRIERLLERAGAGGSARHVSVVSRTGYRWSFALEDARKLLLATHVGGESLSHEHGAPVRLVVPGARGFQWVKWVERIELLDHPDYGAPASTVLSSFSRAGSGAA